jgi:AraC-like DNA-binding protein
MTGKTPTEQHLRELARLRRVRDRIDREYAQPLNVEALARGANMSAGHVRDCAVRDPAGNMIRIQERP